MNAMTMMTAPGEVFDHGDAVCLVDERYDSSFHRFILHSFLSFLSFHSFLFICCIIWLIVVRNSGVASSCDPNLFHGNLSKRCFVGDLSKCCLVLLPRSPGRTPVSALCSREVFFRYPERHNGHIIVQEMLSHRPKKRNCRSNDVHGTFLCSSGNVKGRCDAVRFEIKKQTALQRTYRDHVKNVFIALR